MGFANAKRFTLLLIVLFWGGICCANDRGMGITVLVNNSTRVSKPVLKQMEVETGRIFRAAGVEVAWVECGVGGECRSVPGTNQFVLHIVPNGRTAVDSVLGIAFLGPDGGGKYCNVFLERVEKEHRKSGADIAQLLGAIAAHELGHLVLGSNSHWPVGVMMPLWDEPALTKVGMGDLFFTPEQVSTMRQRIIAGGRQLTDMGSAAGK